MEAYTEKGIYLSAENMIIDSTARFGKDVEIDIKGTLKVGAYSRIGDGTKITGNNITIGDHFYGSGNLRVGGGGYKNPTANLTIGDRCTLHNNFINISEEVIIGNDVGLSHDVSILTHGYWLSVLDGNPARFEDVRIDDGVIIGYRSLIMMGVYIPPECVIGAQSVVTKTLWYKGIYGGSPAKFIRPIIELNETQKKIKIDNIVDHYKTIAKHHGIKPEIHNLYPLIKINGFQFNVLTFEYAGEEDAETDDFRDFIRKYGIRIYTERPFKSAI